MIKRRAFDYLRRCFDAGLDCKRISELQLYNEDDWQALIGSSAFIPKGPADDRLIMVDYPFDDEDDGYRQVYREKDEWAYYCEGRHVVSEDDLRMYQYRMEWFPEWLSQQLQLEPPKALLDTRIWSLGERQGVQVLLVRCLNADFDAIADFIEDQTFTSCLVMSTESLRYKRLALPTGCQLVEVNELILDREIAVDSNRFLSFINPEQARLEREGILWDEHRGILQVYGHEPWILKGAPERCLLISRLYNAGKYHRSPKILTQLLLENVKSNNLSQFFHKDTRWKAFIGYEPGASGYCWLKFFVQVETARKAGVAV